jgi:hypothetical protein
MKHDLNSVSYHLCTTEIGDVRYIYRTCPKKGRGVELKTTTKTNELPMRRCLARYDLRRGPWKIV